MSDFVQNLTDSARRIRTEWAAAALGWRDHTANSFHDRFWQDLEQEADEIAREAAELAEVLAAAREAMRS